MPRPAACPTPRGRQQPLLRILRPLPLTRKTRERQSGKLGTASRRLSDITTPSRLSRRNSRRHAAPAFAHSPALTLLMRRFWGLRSRCKTLRLWQKARPFNSWYMNDYGKERRPDTWDASAPRRRGPLLVTARDAAARAGRAPCPRGLPESPQTHLDDLWVQVPIAAIEVLLQVLGRSKRGLCQVPGPVTPAPVLPWHQSRHLPGRRTRRPGSASCRCAGRHGACEGKGGTLRPLHGPAWLSPRSETSPGEGDGAPPGPGGAREGGQPPPATPQPCSPPRQPLA